MLTQYIQKLEIEFKTNVNSERAAWQRKYLKNQFDFFGLDSKLRRDIQKPFLQAKYLPPKTEFTSIIKSCWEKSEREFQYFALDFSYKYLKKLEFNDIELFEFMILNKSWWDTVDGVAPKLVAEYFKNFPEQRDIYIQRWLDTGNIWLQRTCLIFQLFYKSELDTSLLAGVIDYLLGSKEFFINKAIGWILRQYSRSNPTWVIEFADKTDLHSLSRREALRLIK